MPFLVLPVLVSSEATVVQTTCDSLSSSDIHVRCLEPPRLGARASMALQLPGLRRAEIVVGRVTETTRGVAGTERPGFRAAFVDLPRVSRRRIAEVIARMPQDHRSFPRRPSQLTVRISERTLQARDLSAVGIYVTGLIEAPGSVVELALELPDQDEPARTQAVVIRSGAGLQFTDAKRSFRVRLDRYLASLAPPRGWE